MHVRILTGTGTASTEELTIAAALDEGEITSEYLVDNHGGEIDLTGVDAIVASTTAAPADTFARYGDAPVGVLLLNHVAWDEFGLNVQTFGLSESSITSYRLVDHPITALAGMAVDDVVPATTETTSGRLARSDGVYWTAESQIQVAARKDGSSSNVYLWTCEAGARLADGVTTAPGRRAAMTFAAAVATPGARALFRGVVAWLAGAGAVPPPPPEPVPSRIRDRAGRPVLVKAWRPASSTWV